MSGAQAALGIGNELSQRMNSENQDPDTGLAEKLVIRSGCVNEVSSQFNPGPAKIATVG